MEQAKAILKRIFFLPPLPTLCIALPSFALVIYVLDQGFLGPLAYAVYVLSAYALVISITGGPGIIREFAQWIKDHPLTRKMFRIPLVKRFAEDVRFRTSVSLYQGLTCVWVILPLLVVSYAGGLLYSAGRAARYFALALGRHRSKTRTAPLSPVRGRAADHECGTGWNGGSHGKPKSWVCLSRNLDLRNGGVFFLHGNHCCGQCDKIPQA